MEKERQIRELSGPAVSQNRAMKREPERKLYIEASFYCANNTLREYRVHNKFPKYTFAEYVVVYPCEGEIPFPRSGAYGMSTQYRICAMV